MRILITGGPTRAYLDPVRFLSNISSGALAYALCEEALGRKLDVAAVVGPSPYRFGGLPLAGYLPVETNHQMLEAVRKVCEEFSPRWAILSAAVLDFEPALVAPKKVSSHVQEWTITLKPSPKIVDRLRLEFPAVGRFAFKLETGLIEDRDAYAMRYISEKGLQGLCINFLEEIEGDAHRAYLYDANGFYGHADSKPDIARAVFDLIRKSSGAG